MLNPLQRMCSETASLLKTNHNKHTLVSAIKHRHCKSCSPTWYAMLAQPRSCPGLVTGIVTSTQTTPVCASCIASQARIDVAVHVMLCIPELLYRVHWPFKLITSLCQVIPPPLPPALAAFLRSQHPAAAAAPCFRRCGTQPRLSLHAL